MQNPATYPGTGEVMQNPTTNPGTGAVLQNPVTNPGIGAAVQDPATNPGTGTVLQNPAINPGTGAAVQNPDTNPGNGAVLQNPATNPGTGAAEENLVTNPGSRAVLQNPAINPGTGAVLRLGDNDTFESSVFQGDWKRAKRFIERDPGLLTATISIFSRSALHVAACAGNWEFLVELVLLLPEDALEKPDASGLTALHFAACGGSVKACRALVRKNPRLTQLVSNGGWTPLLTGAYASAKDKDVVLYLFCITTDEPPGYPFSGRWADVLLDLIRRYPSLATTRISTDDIHVTEVTILDAMICRHSDFKSGSNFGAWQNWIYPFVPPKSARLVVDNLPKSSTIYEVFEWPKKLLWNSIELVMPGIKQVREEKSKHTYAQKLFKCVYAELSKLNDSEIHDYFLKSATIVNAAIYGVVEIINLCLHMIPDLDWHPSCCPLLATAVQYRQENIFNLICNRDMYAKMQSFQTVDEFSNTIFHLAAQLAHPSHLKVVSGAALQMQRELQWFKEVEKLMHPALKENREKFGKTAQEVFTEQHKDLMEKGEHWMKDTSNSCMVVTTLIATIMFAAAFTVPGGTDDNTGIPIFLSDNMFMVFVISDALGLIFSSSSLLMFLSILTARYAEEDFLESLPKRLIIGFASLFLAIAAMMIAFAATLSITLRQRSKFVANAVIFFASLPPAIYALLQLPLFFQIYRSTYGSGIFRRKKIQ